MAYVLDRSEQYPHERPSITLRLLGEWKRSLSARARTLTTAGPAARPDLREMATAWLQLDECERTIRHYRSLPDPGATPPWVLENAL